MNKHENEQKVIDRIGKSQLENAQTNNVDMYAQAETANNLGKFTSGLDKVADFDRLYSDSKFPIFSECDRFCKSHEIDSEEMKANRKMRLNQSVDHI